MTLTLTVTDTVGDTAFSTDVTVRENQPPTVALGSISTEVRGGASVNLDGTASDPEGDTLTYAWTSSGGGSFDAAGALNTGWNAPGATDADQTITLTLTVTDDGAGARSTSVTAVVTVKAQSQLAVTITADPTTVNGGGTVMLSSTVTGASGTVFYSWTATADVGTFTDTASPNPVWTAPSAGISDTGVPVRLLVTDSGGTVFATVIVTLRGNQAPEVSASADPTSVAGGGTVTLDGTASDPEGDTLTYAWTSNGGGSFDDAGALDTTWTAPAATDADQTVMLTLTATDDGAGTRSASDTVTVTVEGATNAAPVFTSADNFSADENQMAVGTVIATDADAGDAVSYAVTGGADQAHFRDRPVQRRSDLRLGARPRGAPPTTVRTTSTR